MLEPLLLDLLEWVAKETRSYANVMEAWRTSCPRLPVWEEAIDRGFVQRMTTDGRSAKIVLTEAGCRFLRDSRRRADYRVNSERATAVRRRRAAAPGRRW